MRAVFAGLRGLQRRTGAAVVVANGENAVDGYGLTPEVVDRILGFGVQVITSGNHVWQHPVLHHTLEQEQRLLRPENYLPDAPGHGWCVVRTPGADVGVLNVQGRHALPSPRCPFRTADSAVAALRTRTPVIVVDMHAESSEEKEALALHLDGRVSAVIGTHTHVTTADERILPGGTAYITDVGMTGPAAGVIGFDQRVSVRRSLSQMPPEACGGRRSKRVERRPRRGGRRQRPRAGDRTHEGRRGPMTLRGFSGRLPGAVGYGRSSGDSRGFSARVSPG